MFSKQIVNLTANHLQNYIGFCCALLSIRKTQSQHIGRKKGAVQGSTFSFSSSYLETKLYLFGFPESTPQR